MPGHEDERLGMMTIREAITVVVLAGTLLAGSIMMLAWSLASLVIAVPAAWAVVQGLRAIGRRIVVAQSSGRP